MSSAVSGILFIALIVAWLVVSLRFRAGKHRAIVRWYRSSSSPRALRNLPIVSPVMYGLLLPLMIAASPVLLGLQIDFAVNTTVAKVVVLAAGSYLLLAFATSAFLLYRMPQWLLPKWLREEDSQLGYVSAPADWFDKLLLGGLGSACLLLGVVLLFNMIRTILQI